MEVLPIFYRNQIEFPGVGTDDARSYLITGLVKVLHSTHLDDVKIQQLCDTARISRSMFYRLNFRTPRDVLEGYLKAHKALFKRQLARGKKTAIRETYQRLFQALDQFQPVLLALQQADYLHPIMYDHIEELTQMALQTHQQVGRTVADGDDFIFLQKGIAGVIIHWYGRESRPLRTYCTRMESIVKHHCGLPGGTKN